MLDNERTFKVERRLGPDMLNSLPAIRSEPVEAQAVHSRIDFPQKACPQNGPSSWVDLVSVLADRLIGNGRLSIVAASSSLSPLIQ
jgi:hypothetical protein